MFGGEGVDGEPSAPGSRPGPAGPGRRARSASAYSRIAVYSSLIFALPLTVGGLTYLGWELDRRWGSSPWATLIGFFLGTAAALFEVIRVVGLFRGRTRGGGR
ncbi:MAG: hypothetical protein Kow00109_04780 [Acidobacteriota bacterium]